MRLFPKGLRVVILAAAVGAGLVCAACGSSSDRAKSTEQKVQDFVHRVTKVVREGEASWPQEIPADVPPFTQGRLAAVQKALMANGTSWTMILADIDQEGVDAYFNVLSDAGWETTRVKSETGGNYSARRESLSLNLIFSGNRGTLIIRLVSF